MRIVVLYRPAAEYTRQTEAFVHDFRREHDDVARLLTVMNYDSREGSAMASLYDIFQEPAVLILNDDGSLLKYWAGGSLPLLDEVAGYVRTIS